MRHYSNQTDYRKYAIVDRVEKKVLETPVCVHAYGDGQHGEDA